MVHPLFGLYAEPASTMIISADPNKLPAIEKLADHFNFNIARIGTTGGDRLKISVYSDVLISAPLLELREQWAHSLEDNIHGEVTA
jgi:phosphoribosylformylglycinamidine synthase